jgi:putative ABC transport system permease protein
MRDIVFSIRSLRKSPAFALTAIFTIALGIGASTAIFSVVNAVLLRPLPYRDPGRLVLVWEELRARHLPDFPFSPGNFDDMRRSATLFEGFAAVNTFRASYSDENGQAEQIKAATVTRNFFSLVGHRVELGRDFIASDETPPPPPRPGAAPAAGPPAMAILSHEFWEKRYGADPHIIGRGVDLGFGKAQIVGVAAPDAEILFPPSAGLETRPEVWTAARIDYVRADRNNVFLRVIGRLKSGVTIAQANGQLETIAADLRARFPVIGTANTGITVEPMQQRLVAKVRPALLAMMGAVIFLLLIACANVANLLLVRMAARDRELAVRAALGGSRWRLVRQMLSESLMIAAAGVALGLGLARLGIDWLIALAPKSLPRTNVVALDPLVLAFAVLAAIGAAAAFGIVPALRASRPNLANALRSSGRTAGLGSGAFLRNGVVTAEVALSFVLLIGSGLMLRSFLALSREDPGFDARGKLTFFLPVLGNTPDLRAARMRDLSDRFRHLPGVTSLTAASPFPLDGGVANGKYGREDAVTDQSRFRQANVFFVLPGYFQTMGTRIVEGRGFTEADNVQSSSGIVIDQLLAAKAFPHESAVGKRLFIRIRTPLPEWVTVLGVVAHERHESLSEDGREEMFVTDGFIGFGAASRWAIASDGDPMRLAPLVREEIAKFDKRLAVDDIMPMQALVEQAQAQTRFSLILIALFAAIAAALAAVGLYGVISSAVRQRTAELGVRMAVGAAPWSLFQLVVAHGLRLSAAGIAIGVLAALALTRAMESMLIGVTATDPVTYCAMALAFLLVAAAACWIPARRAAGLDPVKALREE